MGFNSGFRGLISIKELGMKCIYMEISGNSQPVYLSMTRSGNYLL